jgi:hypothetical protein
VESIFRVSWQDVALSDVKAFLEDAGDEGILWEAKAADPRKKGAKITAPSASRSPRSGPA